MKVVIAGGSGQVGQILRRFYLAKGAEVVVLTRGKARTEKGTRFVTWDGKSVGRWFHEIEGSDVLIGLAGRSVNCRYHEKNRREIFDSRVHSARALGQALAICQRPPRVWLQASTATIYAHTFGAAHTEASGQLGGREADAPESWNFSIEVARAWEHAVIDGPILPKTRVLLLRSAMTMSPDAGGVFATLLRLARWGLAGPMGHGRQYISWIHETDFVRAVDWLVQNEALAGPVILAAPEALPNADFLRELRLAWGNPIGLPATAWMLEIGAFLLQTETELILKSRRVYPEILLQSGFTFQFPTWREAAQELCARWRQRNP